MTAAFPFPVSLRPGRSRFGAVTSRPLITAYAIIALLTAMRMTGTVDSDVAWQLWVAGRLNAGAQLYRDIIEVNPPLWFWMARPIDALATFLHVRPEPVLVAAVGGLVMLALSATDRLLRRLSPARRTLFLGYAAVLLVGMPWVHIGQREQIALIGTLPYTALIAARRASRPISPLLAFFIGLGAALGFALKHYFLLVPAALELWLISGQGKAWRWRRPEIVALALTGAVYLAAILLWAQGFLTTIVPLVRLSYGGLGAPSFAALFGPFAVCGMLALLLAASQVIPFARKDDRIGSTLLVAASAFAAIYFIQAKGWIYHAISLIGCSSLALAAFLVEQRNPRPLLRIMGPAMMFIPLALSFNEQRQWAPGPDLTNAVAGLHRGDSVGFLSVETAVPWSVTLQGGYHYPSRYMGFWMLNAAVMNERSAHPDPRLTALGRQIVSETVADFRCTPPRRIIAARPLPGERGFDTLAFFLRDPQFASLLSHYREGPRVGLQHFDLVTPWAPPPPSSCRAHV